MRTSIKVENGQHNAYYGRKYIATINVQRKNPAAQGDYGVAWATGRYDWHNTFQEAQDNVRKYLPRS